jgi:hypothetical protein
MKLATFSSDLMSVIFKTGDSFSILDSLQHMHDNLSLCVLGNLIFTHDILSLKCSNVAVNQMTIVRTLFNIQHPQTV